MAHVKRELSDAYGDVLRQQKVVRSQIEFCEAKAGELPMLRSMADRIEGERARLWAQIEKIDPTWDPSRAPKRVYYRENGDVPWGAVTDWSLRNIQLAGVPLSAQEIYERVTEQQGLVDLTPAAGNRLLVAITNTLVAHEKRGFLRRAGKGHPPKYERAPF